MGRRRVVTGRLKFMNSSLIAVTDPIGGYGGGDRNAWRDFRPISRPESGKSC